MEVVWSETAFESVADILAYVGGFFGEKVAQRVAREIFSFAAKLGRQPYLGRQFMHMPDGSEVRCALYKVNRIYFQIFADHVEIIIVWDGRQDPDRLRDILRRHL